MPTIGTREATPVLKAPACSECGKPMRLDQSVPNLVSSNIDEVKYVCNCGHTTERIVGR
jgi:lysyl-tRNA synthetase class I